MRVLFEWVALMGGLMAVVLEVVACFANAFFPWLGGALLPDFVGFGLYGAELGGG